jgi:hypothetical protein
LTGCTSVKSAEICGKSESPRLQSRPHSEIVLRLPAAPQTGPYRQIKEAATAAAMNRRLAVPHSGHRLFEPALWMSMVVCSPPDYARVRTKPAGMRLDGERTFAMTLIRM